MQNEARTPTKTETKARIQKLSPEAKEVLRCLPVEPGLAAVPDVACDVFGGEGMSERGQVQDCLVEIAKAFGGTGDLRGPGGRQIDGLFCDYAPRRNWGRATQYGIPAEVFPIVRDLYCVKPGPAHGTPATTQSASSS